ncbi:MAG: hypothetical protein COX52_07475 [Syntrophobacterales bacterium CG23_combo_of_CG06-09_8_20_14_all_48_27]|nr:MAG: hypothetical protein COX52_07475 [Syntrophobacterales bacterium CG23_combo_of_CG06-09_8_20_14_all_48_27]
MLSQNYRQSFPFCGGLEIGAVSVKWVGKEVGENREPVVKILRHEGNPRGKAQEIIEHHLSEGNSRIVVTGPAAKALFDLPYRAETECLEAALSFHHLKPDILLSLGGETFTVYPMRKGEIKSIISSSKCAAGTGEFLIQQFQRMGLSLPDGLAAVRFGKVVPLATRCSVHCKTDVTHKLNKGECTPNDVARSLIHDLTKKICKMIELTNWPADLIVVSGGLALNEPFLKTLQELLPDSRVIVLKESSYLEAFGAYLYACEPITTSGGTLIPVRGNCLKRTKPVFETMKPLREAEPLLDYRVCPGREGKPIEGGSYILSVDAGSTTTKAVLLNVSDVSIGAGCYLRTYGNPVRATEKCLRELIKQVGNKGIKIIQAGTTGSGREMVSVYLDNCLAVNEILAHARAATHEAPEVDTVFEIGGQDAKFIHFLKGVPVDYAMNEGCSAGTGSFLEESALRDMGIAVEEISKIAYRSDHPVAFGERCAAFISTDLRNALQQGAGREDVVAGLVYSIADNYISRIVGARHVGGTVLFQGGVALNRSVALAMAARTHQKIVVPPRPEFMGCIGAALIVRDRLNNGDVTEKRYKLEEIVLGSMEVKGIFSCPGCENRCEIKKIALRDRIYPFGGLCSRYELQRQRGKETEEGRDLVAVRNALMFGEFGPKQATDHRGTIGLPMSLTTYELFPFYTSLINELGFNVVLSEPSKIGNAKTIAPICYPCEVVHGAVYDLLQRNVDFIFLPRVIEMEVPYGHLHGYTCPSTTVIPDIIKGAFGGISDKILSPHIGLAGALVATTLKEIVVMAGTLGIGKKAARRAAEKAIACYERFRKMYIELGRQELERLMGEPAVIVAGRPYTTCSPEVNLALPRKIASRGYHVIPADMLPPSANSCHPRNVWHYTQQITDAIAYVKKFPNLYLSFVSCFSCGPDASIYYLIREELAGDTFCYLEIDSHTAHAGFETRVGAFLDIVEERRRPRK